MRYIKCEQCGCQFSEDDSNPSIHYSVPDKICMHCSSYNKLKIGEWYQKENGEYYQKLYEHPKICPNCGEDEVTYERFTLDKGEYVCDNCCWGMNALTGEITNIGLPEDEALKNGG